MVKLRHDTSPYFAASVENTVFFFLCLALLVALSFGVITVVHERLLAELKAEHEEKVHAEQELAQEERLAALGRLTGGVAHFFNNQICIIQLGLSLLRDSLSASGITPPTF